MSSPLANIVALTAALVCFSHTAVAQVADHHVDSPQIRFNFAGAPWRSVLQWLAETGDYALYVGDLPLGSLTYSDEKAYTLDEAINRINMFLIPQRYTLVRSAELLSVISLDDETSVRQLDSMASIVSAGELNRHGSHELLKCFFPLGAISPSHAIEELNGLMLIREPSVLPNTNQLMVMDTAEKLRTVARVLGSLARPDTTVGPVKRYALGDLDPEKTLIQVRPHVGLDPLAMTGTDVRLSIDKERRQLLASGSVENLAAIANVIALLQDTNTPAVESDELTFRPHDLGDAEMQTVVNVLQTLLAEEDVRLAPDAGSNQLAVLANEQVHELVNRTIQDLSGAHNAMEFKVLEVDSIDARYAAVVLNDMFSSQLDASEVDSDPSATPRIDADSVSGRLFVRARKSQLEEIEHALMQMGHRSPKRDGKLRLLPYHGEQVKTLLESALKFWPYENDIEVVPSLDDGSDAKSLEREINSEMQQMSLRDDAQRNVALVNHLRSVFSSNEIHDARREPDPSEKTTSTDIAANIRVQQTPGGLLVLAKDAEAMERFEEHLRLISGSRYGNDRRLAVFYLKHATIDDANKLLRQLLADESLMQNGNPAGLTRLSLPQHVVDAAGGLHNAWGYDTATVIPDQRLNRLFVYGTQQELDAIEKHLQVIDRENSIAEIKTRGIPRMIQLDHARAEDVAAVIRDTYSGRIASTAKEKAAATASRNQNQEGRYPGESSQPKSATNASPQTNTKTEGDEDQMTVAVDAQSNVVVVTAPSQLADEVEALARAIDQESQRVVQVIPLSGVEPLHLQTSLRTLFGDQVYTGQVRQNGSPPSGSAK